MGYNWAGCNWAGYDRNGWDRDGRNEWGQRRGHPGDPRNQDWYNHHHPYEQYYQWRFQNDDPVYHRTQWDHAHGFNPNLYQHWNMSRDWHDPRNRDWAPPATTKSATNVDIRASSPVVNLNASLTQFISTDRATNNSRSLMKDLADKSARDFTRELTPRNTTISIGSPPPSTLEERPATPSANHQTSFAPPALTAPAPATPPSKVSPGFTAPKLPPVPAYTPPAIAQPQGKSAPTPSNNAPRRHPDPSSGPMAIPPKGDSPNPAVAPPAEQVPASPPNNAVTPPARIRHLTRPIPVRRRRSQNRGRALRYRHSKSLRSSGVHRNHPSSTLRLPRPSLVLPRPRSDRRPSAKHLLRGRRTWLRSGPSDRRRPCTRRRVLPRDLLLSHVRHPHQGHPSVQFRCVDGFSTPISIGPRLVGQRLRSPSDRCPAGVVDVDVHDDVVDGLAAPPGAAAAVMSTRPRRASAKWVHLSASTLVVPARSGLDKRLAHSRRQHLTRSRQLSLQISQLPIQDSRLGMQSRTLGGRCGPHHFPAGD